MRVHVLQYVPFEGIGCMASWLELRDAEVTYTRFYEVDDLPVVAGFDLIIVMGGPMNVLDESAYTWLKGEKSFVREAMEAGISVLGVYLGAQIIADVMGARVFSNAYKEIGWFSIEPVEGGESTFTFPERLMAFHWHGDTFNLPETAVLLARSEGCTNQAFQVGKKVIGLRFHLETTMETTELMIENCPGNLLNGRYVQNVDAMRKSTAAYKIIANSFIFAMLDYLTSDLGQDT